jgi:hypothetical protein
LENSYSVRVIPDYNIRAISICRKLIFLAANSMNQDPQKETQTEKENWEAPKLAEIDIRSTESNIGSGGDGSGGGFNASWCINLNSANKKDASRRLFLKSLELYLR